MRILIVGAHGTIGNAVSKALSGHELVKVGRSSGQIKADLANSESIRAMYETAGELDAVVCVAGTAEFGAITELTDAGVASTFADLRGRVNLVRYGLSCTREGGTFVLTSGSLSRTPQPSTSIISPMGAAIEMFVKTASLSLPNGQRINGVSPPLVLETAIKNDYGEEGVPAATVASWYVEAIESDRNGEIRGLEGWS